jgi:hypothetical protein
VSHAQQNNHLFAAALIPDLQQEMSIFNETPSSRAVSGKEILFILPLNNCRCSLFGKNALALRKGDTVLFIG